MKSIVTLGTILLSCWFVGSAQATSMPNQSSQSVTVQGCLTKPTAGVYILDSSDGGPYRLRGDNAQLNKYVDDQIRVKGNVTGTSSLNPAAMASSTANSTATQLNVRSIRKVTSCIDWSWY